MFIILYYYQFYFILYPLPSLMGGVGGEAFSIFNLLQEQSSCRHTIAGLASVLLFYHLAEALNAERSAADFHQCAYDSSHHITQEAVGGDFEAPFVVGKLNPSGHRDVADIRLGVGVQF